MKKERTATTTYVDEEIDPKWTLYFMDFINEAARVIKIRKKKNNEDKIKD